MQKGIALNVTCLSFDPLVALRITASSSQKEAYDEHLCQFDR